jgi:hypothetical protein
LTTQLLVYQLNDEQFGNPVERAADSYCGAGKEKLNKDDDYTKIIGNIFATWKAIKTKYAVLINFSEVQKPTIKDTPYFLEG